MRISDLLLTAATFITFIIALYLFTSDPMLSSSVNWAEDRPPSETASGRPATVQAGGAQGGLPDNRLAPPAPAPVRFSPAITAVNYPPAGRWKYIVIHHSATKQGNAAIFDGYHRREKGMRDGLAYHFVIGNGTKSKDGQIEVGRRWEKQMAGAHCYDNKMNQESVGICLVGNFDVSKPTARQMESLRKLMSDLQNHYRIPQANILLHKEVDKRQTNCPGRNLPANKIR